MCKLKIPSAKASRMVKRESATVTRSRTRAQVGTEQRGHHCNWPQWSNPEIKTTGCGNGKTWILLPVPADICIPPWELPLVTKPFSHKALFSASYHGQKCCLPAANANLAFKGVCTERSLLLFLITRERVHRAQAIQITLRVLEPHSE